MEMSPDNSTDPNDSDASTLLANPSRRLTCGAIVDDLLEQAADGHATNLTEHQRTCGHCKPALAAFASLWAPVMEAAAKPAPVPPTSAAAISAGVLAGIALSTPAPAGGAAASIPKPRNIWHWLLLSSVVLAAAITALFLTQHLSHTTNDSPKTQHSANPTATNHSTTLPNSVRAAPPTSTHPGRVPTRPVPKKSASLPTGVPAGNGGEAAATSLTVRHNQLLILIAGIAITAAGAANLGRAHRAHRSRRGRRARRR